MTETNDRLDRELRALPTVDSPGNVEIRERAHQLLAKDGDQQGWLRRLEPALWIAASAVYLAWAAGASFAIHQ
ncbi:MAG: hypothetical protein KJO07_19640 [Deltaproteobacteria bacterium]|nr:hypothetical protein [Deltaproteobacteria bacterium]